MSVPCPAQLPKSSHIGRQRVLRHLLEETKCRRSLCPDASADGRIEAANLAKAGKKVTQLRGSGVRSEKKLVNYNGWHNDAQCCSCINNHQHVEEQ